MPDQKKYVQTWNKRSKKYVLIEKGKRGGMTGKMQAEPFEGVPIEGGKPKQANEPDEQELRDYEDQPTELEKESQKKENEKPEKSRSFLSILTGKKS